MHRTYSKLGALIAMASVIIGAFGAHYLKSLLSIQSMESIETATFYQFVHALGLFAVANNYRYYRKKRIIWAGNMMVVGIILFSGSIYLRILMESLGYGNGWMVAMITPLGGLCLILSWLMLFVGIPSADIEEPKKNEEN
jgi:uncharacterized membrane protein YgdD (TMEM256/DUF423 family)